jgi:putative sigma-54 modulation protein
MNIIVSARHMQLTEAMNNSVTESLKALKHNKDLTQAEVVLDTDHHKLVAEIHLHGKGININAKAETENMYEAIDNAVEKLQKQLNKKVGLTHHQLKGKHLGDIEAEIVS